MPNILTFRYRGNRRILRTGASAVEAAITLPIFLWILLAMLDLGIAVIQFNALSDAAKRLSRAAGLRGTLSSQVEGTWGPESILTDASSNSPVVAMIRQSIPTMHDKDVIVHLSWPDGDNRPLDRVHVELQFVHESIVPAIIPWGPFNLTASATMSIVN